MLNKVVSLFMMLVFIILVIRTVMMMISSDSGEEKAKKPLYIIMTMILFILALTMIGNFFGIKLVGGSDGTKVEAKDINEPFKNENKNENGQIILLPDNE